MYRAKPLLALMLILASPPGLALESDKEQPIELAADSVDIDESKGMSIYRGDVDLRQGSMHLRADVVTVHQNNRKPTKIIAEGRPVKFQQATGQGSGKGRGQARGVRGRTAKTWS